MSFSKKRLKRWQLAGFLVSTIAGMSISTQQFADRLSYHPALGEPLVHAQDIAIYWPWQWLVWALSYYESTPTIFDETILGIAGGFFVGMVWMIALKKRLSPKPMPTSHGSSRWATPEEVESTGLIARADDLGGVVIGQNKRGEYLTHDGKEHAFCFAPTRSGKGVGLVIPTLLTWKESVVVLDIKGENWEITAPWRALFSHCIYFNPADPKSAHFNPLLEIRRGPEEVRDTRNLVEILCDPDGEQKGSDFWTESAKSLLTAAILHVLYAEKDKSLAGVLTFLRSPNRDLEDTLSLMKSTHHKGQKPHPLIEQAAQSMLNMADKARSGVISTAERFLNLFEDPILAEVTSTSDFRLVDLQRAAHPASLYMVVPPSDMTRLRPVLRLLLIQMGAALTETLDPENRKHRLLMLLDEFPTLGRLDWFEAALAYVAGYDIKCYLIAQDLNQIEKAYGQNNAILGNCHIRVAFAPNDERTARRISDMLGTSTATKKTESLSGKRGAFSLENRSESDVEFARPLLTPGEVMQLPADESIVFIAGQYPMRTQKVRYFEDPHFQRRCPAWNAKLKPLELSGAGYPDVPGECEHDWKDVLAPPCNEGIHAIETAEHVVIIDETEEITPPPPTPVINPLDLLLTDDHEEPAQYNESDVEDAPAGTEDPEPETSAASSLNEWMV